MKAKSISIQVKDERLFTEIMKYKKLVKQTGTALWTIEGQAVLQALKDEYRKKTEV